jgi:hypothetical protein
LPKFETESEKGKLNSTGMWNHIRYFRNCEGAESHEREKEIKKEYEYPEEKRSLQSPEALHISFLSTPCIPALESKSKRLYAELHTMCFPHWFKPV